MKKLKLKELNLGELLTREQMKNVVGGDYGPGDCQDGCDTFNPCPPAHPYCQTTSCTDKNGVQHFVKACSPTQV